MYWGSQIWIGCGLRMLGCMTVSSRSPTNGRPLWVAVWKQICTCGRTTRAKAPEALWSVYGKFWQKAFEDYWNEYLALGQLYTEVVTPRTSASQQCSKGGFLHAKAA